MVKERYNIFWIRRDIRLHDNHALFTALKSGLPVIPLFVFDTTILSRLSDRADKRVQFIHDQLSTLKQRLLALGSDLLCVHGSPVEVFAKLCEKYELNTVFANEDYEPEALVRDQAVKKILQAQGVALRLTKDQVIWSPSEVLKTDNSPYTVYTPYSKLWKTRLHAIELEKFNTEPLFHNLSQQKHDALPRMEDLGFMSQKLLLAPVDFPDSLLEEYHDRRDIPALDATSHLSVHLRFGTLSIRDLVRRAQRCSETWLNELIWREFFMMILGNFPHVIDRCFKAQYERIAWRNNESEFEAWCEGRTGYPIVDAGMRELNETGFMHNRVRMIVASFLCKHLLIDWRWGEAYFAQKLLDFDASANNGNWQWSAGCGCDAAPYFRIFNPSEQSRKFDAKQEYTKRWLGVDDFLRPPIVEHSFARERCLEVYREALRNGV